jgi:hypothetical protein
MIVLRLLFILTALALVLSGGMYMFTRDRRYLNFAWQVLRVVVYLTLVFGLLFVLQRYVLAGWGILV